MKESIFNFIIILLMVFLSFVMGYSYHKPETEYRDVIVRDTVYRTDTIIEKIPILREVVRVDTVEVVMQTVTHDTVAVSVPIEHLHERFESGEVWYHGHMAGIDSLLAYKHTQLIHVESIRRDSPWGMGLNVGYGAGKNGFSPYIGIGVQYRLLGFPRRKYRKERNLDYE